MSEQGFGGVGATGGARTAREFVRDIIRGEFRNPIFLALLVLACVLASYGVVAAAKDGPGDHFWTMPLAILAPALPTVWSVLRSLWLNIPARLAVSDAAVRLLIIPALVTVPTALAAVVTVQLPAVQRLIEQARRPEDGWHYTFAPDDGTLLGLVLLGAGLLGFTAAILAGLVAWVFVVLPVMAFGSPARFAQVNQLDPGPEHARGNALALKALSVLLMLIFLIPTLIIFGKDAANSNTLGEALWNSLTMLGDPDPARYLGDLAWSIGAVLIPVGGVAFGVAKLFQKPDKGRR